jgi:hypothetical protein
VDMRGPWYPPARGGGGGYISESVLTVRVRVSFEPVVLIARRLAPPPFHGHAHSTACHGSNLRWARIPSLGRGLRF